MLVINFLAEKKATTTKPPRLRDNRDFAKINVAVQISSVLFTKLFIEQFGNI
jgi:hypothetical protein